MPLLTALLLAQSTPLPAQLTLLQMEVTVPASLGKAQHVVERDLFIRDTQTIRSCEDAARLAARYRDQKRFKGRLTIRNGVPVAALPPIIQAELRSRPMGHATKVYFGPNALRVLIACATPVAAQGVQETI